MEKSTLPCCVLRLTEATQYTKKNGFQKRIYCSAMIFSKHLGYCEKNANRSVVFHTFCVPILDTGVMEASFKESGNLHECKTAC